MLMHESTVGLLWHLARRESHAIDELKCRTDWLVLRLSLVWDVLDRNKVDLQRVQLLAVEI